MLSRAVVIVVCISMVGITVVPASWMPCCCKFKSKALESERPIASCCAEKFTANLTAPSPPSHSCCPVDLKDRSCACGSVIKGVCSACRCAEQMQVIALSGYSAQDETAKDHLVAISSVSPFSVILSLRSPVSPEVVDPPGMVTLLRTLILVC